MFVIPGSTYFAHASVNRAASSISSQFFFTAGLLNYDAAAILIRKAHERFHYLQSLSIRAHELAFDFASLRFGWRALVIAGHLTAPMLSHEIIFGDGRAARQPQDASARTAPEREGAKLASVLNAGQ
jgi:hypothetical protein